MVCGCKTRLRRKKRRNVRVEEDSFSRVGHISHYFVNHFIFTYWIRRSYEWNLIWKQIEPIFTTCFCVVYSPKFHVSGYEAYRHFDTLRPHLLKTISLHHRSRLPRHHHLQEVLLQDLRLWRHHLAQHRQGSRPSTSGRLRDQYHPRLLEGHPHRRPHQSHRQRSRHLHPVPPRSPNYHHLPRRHLHLSWSTPLQQA